nr:transglycosylase SLT domain-containing protein [Roseomonas acroporae]
MRFRRVWPASSRRRAALPLLLLLCLAAPARAQTAPDARADTRAPWNPDAALELGLRYELGLGVAADPARAATLICRAAAGGHAPAVLHLAATLLEPDLPGYDPPRAAQWLRFLQTRQRLGSAARLRPPGCPGDMTAPGNPAPYAALVEQLALERGLSPFLVKAVIAVESAWRPDAVSRAGAQGLMQLMPATARHHGVADPFDPEQNLRGGMDHLALLLRQFGDPALALAAYNAGQAPVLACRCVPPIPETESYVSRIRALGGLDGPALAPRLPTFRPPALQSPAVPAPPAPARADPDRAAPASRAASGARVRAPAPRG